MRVLICSPIEEPRNVGAQLDGSREIGDRLVGLPPVGLHARAFVIAERVFRVDLDGLVACLEHASLVVELPINPGDKVMSIRRAGAHRQDPLGVGQRRREVLQLHMTVAPVPDGEAVAGIELQRPVEPLDRFPVGVCEKSAKIKRIGRVRDQTLDRRQVPGGIDAGNSVFASGSNQHVSHPVVRIGAQHGPRLLDHLHEPFPLNERARAHQTRIRIVRIERQRGRRKLHALAVLPALHHELRLGDESRDPCLT